MFKTKLKRYNFDIFIIYLQIYFDEYLPSDLSDIFMLTTFEFYQLFFLCISIPCIHSIFINNKNYNSSHYTNQCTDQH